MADPALQVRPRIDGLWGERPDSLYLLRGCGKYAYWRHNGRLGLFASLSIREAQLAKGSLDGRGLPSEVELREFDECVDLARAEGHKYMAIHRPGHWDPEWFYVGQGGPEED